MTTVDFLADIRARGVVLWREGDRLRLRAPKELMGPALLDPLKERKAELLDLLASEEATDLEPFALSEGQEGIWGALSLQPDRPDYNVHAVLRVAAGYDADRLAAALNALAARHPMLRARFASEAGEPRQRIEAEAGIPLARATVEALAEPSTHAKIDAEIDAPFDLAHGAVRGLLVETAAPGEALLVLTMHHLIADFWALGLVVRDLAGVYARLGEGVAPFERSETPEYRDFIAARRAAPTRERDLVFWDDELGRDMPVLMLPRATAQPGPAAPRTITVTTPLDAEVAAAIRTTARALRVTPFVFMIGAFQATLARFTQADEVIVGIPYAGRTEPGADECVGHFVNLLPLRSAAMTGTVADFVAATGASVAAAVGHQGIAYETLSIRYPRHRRPGRTPLFDVMFNWNKEMVSAEEDGAGLFEAFLRGGSMGVTGASHDLVLSVIEHADGAAMSLRWTHRTAAYDDATITSLQRAYRALVAAAAAVPGRPVADLPLMTDADAAALIADHGIGDQQPVGPDVVARIEEKAAAQPDAVAISDATTRIAYGEMNARANRLARYLCAHGVGPERRVAIRLPRCTDYAMAALGVMKTGAAFVPIDLSQPPARVDEILQEADVDIVLMRSEDALELSAGRHMVEFVDLLDIRTAHDRADDLGIMLPPGLPAYVLFTSGTTGAPKGAMTSHRQLANILDWSPALNGAGPGVRSSQLSSNAFDASAFEIWPHLASGGEVRFVAPDEMVAPERLPALIDTLDLGACFLSTAVYDLVPIAAWEAIERPLTLVIGGSALQGSAPANPLIRLVNAYGPTEAAIIVAAGEIRERGLERYPLGTPVANARLRLLDARQRPVPFGAVGEIHIGGLVVSDGYIGQPALSAAAFSPDPFGVHSGARHYRTGDYARFLPGGELEFLGRRAGQVKVAGFRVELGEVERKLLRLDAVAAAGVALERTATGERLVAAYVPVRPGVDGEAHALLGALAGMLPGYMVPTLLAPVAALPLTRNAKLDRDALIRLVASFSATPDAAGPQSAFECDMAAIWASVLQVESVRPHAGFFEMGGHSLLAIQLVERINGAFGTSLRVGDLIKLQTVAAVAAALTGSPSNLAVGAPQSLASQIGDGDRSRYEPFPLTDTQYAYWIGRNGVFDLGNVATHIYTEMNLRDFDVDEVEGIWNQLIARHDMLRAVVSVEGTQRVLRDVPPYRIAVDDLSALDASACAEHLTATRERMSHQVFDPQRWPLFEIRLSKLGDNRFRLHTGIDALIADAGSFAIIEQEYDVIARGEGHMLPPLGITFRDYVLAERGLADTPAYDRARDYWLARLDALPPAPDLPLARDPQMLSSGRFVRHEGRLDAASWNILKAKARQLNLTATTLLLTAFAEVLRTWSVRADFTLNLTLFNRVPLHPDVDHLVGDFTSLVLLEVDGAGAGFADRALGVQQRLWEDIENRLFTGVQVLRELTRRQGGRPVTMPVVFTSLLPLGDERAQAPRSEAGDDEGFTITQTSQVWIDHVATEVDGALSFHWDVVEELFPPAMIETMIAAYRGVLEALVVDDAAWSAGALPAPSEQLAVRARVNDTAASISGERMEDAFLAQADLRPDAPAVLWDGGEMSYGEVRFHACRLATRLRAGGAGPGRLVAIVHPRGWQQVVAVLAIQLAGAAYLPVDPDWPSSRQHAVMAAGGVDQVVTSPALADAMPGGLDLSVVTIERAAETCDAERPAPLSDDRDVAYVIFTSGSTGQPKGVAIDHRGAVNTIRDVNARIALGPADRTLALSALSFDLSVYDIFGPLSVGGALVCPADDAIRNPERWVHHLGVHGVTVVNAVPSFLQMYADYRDVVPDEAAGLRIVLMSGDWIPVALPARLRGIAPDAAIMSLGGATEASIWSVVQPIGNVDPAWSSIPYGTPLANQTLHVLRQDFSACPDWVAGDLYIGGIGLALGYRGDPARTADSFVTHPATGERLYRTGDLARYRNDGVIEFLGRRDAQVKVRGHRIELGEIETVLAGHADVAAAAAAATGVGEKRRLSAYVVPRPGALAALRGAAASSIDHAAGAADETVDHTYLTDVVERLMFKFADHGLRRLPPDAERIALAGLVPDLALYGAAPAPAGEAAVLDALCAAMRASPVEDSPLAKRLYPSAGSLYPVQLHVALAPGNDAPGGYFYHDPLEHVLIRTGIDVPSATELLLVVEDAAIRPLYGTAAQALARLEAGYAAHLLDAAARALGWRIDRVAAEDDAQARRAFGLRTSQWIAARLRLATWGAAAEPPLDRPADWFDRQSYRSFASTPLEAAAVRGIAAAMSGRAAAGAPAGSPPGWSDGDVSVQFFLKPGRISGMLPGLYDVDLARGTLTRSASDAADMSAAFMGDAAGLYAGSAIAVLVRATTAGDAALFAAGAIGQQLMLTAGLFDLGFCPIGHIRQDVVPGEAVVVHSFVGGGVAAAQRRAWIQVEKPDAEALLSAMVVDHVRELLPNYMIPDSISVLDELPLGANGKIDRAALAGMATGPIRNESGYIKPANSTEQQVADIFADILDCGRVGATDDFFGLGGNSVKAVQAFRKIATAMNAELLISDIFAYPRVRDLARRVESMNAVTTDIADGSGRSARRRDALARQQERLQQRKERATA